MARRLINAVRRIMSRFRKSDTQVLTGREYWEDRVLKYGRRSVLNIKHSEDEYEQVTALQKARLFTILASQLNGREKVALDFGCGPGRFTPDLADLIRGNSIGVDPIPQFLEMAPKKDKAEYLLLENQVIPLADASADVVWVCLVLGGITEENELGQTAREINRVLKSDGLLFLVENTTDAPSAAHWKFRPFESYEKLCSFAPLRYLSDYYDAGERISIMAGRKAPSRTEEPLVLEETAEVGSIQIMAEE